LSIFSNYVQKIKIPLKRISGILRNDPCTFVIIFYDRMTVHHNRFLVNKTNRWTEIKFYWYYGSTCFGQPFCPSSGVLSLTSALVHFMQLWWPFAAWQQTIFTTA